MGNVSQNLKWNLRERRKEMDSDGKDDYELENGNENSIDCSPSMSSGWRFGGAQLLKTSMGLMNPPNFSGQEGLNFPPCSSASMVDSLGPNFNGGFFDLYSNVSSSNLVGISRDNAGSLGRTSSMSWNIQNQTRANNLLVFPHPSLPQLPSDSAFIERAARLSCFNGGNLMEIASPFGIPQSMALYSQSSGTNPGNQEINSIDGMKSARVGQAQKQEISDIREASMDVCLEQGTESDEKGENLLRSHNEEKCTIGGSGGESEDEICGGAQDEPSNAEGREEGPSDKGTGPKKRKRVEQLNNGLEQAKDESPKDDKEIEQKDDQNPNLVANKSTIKHSKQGSQASDPPKEEYIHVRARRGQATNSHSLAERVRREKISERMKFLQDLVPGCSKVTGKAVMLDEIINYVQSLQLQVEFLSMKLSTVNPRMDFNIEGLAKGILQARAGSSSSLGYSPDISMAYPPLRPPQHALLSSGVQGMGSSSQILRRTLSSHLTTPMAGGFKEPSQVPNVWEDELHHVFQMSYPTAVPSNSHHSGDGSLTPTDMKVEL